jgi:calcium-dependent protein kinase
MLGSHEEAIEHVENIMRQVDADGSGAIDYTEFVIATMNKKKLLSKKNLEAAFNEFDKDGSGSITTDELKAMLGGENIKEDLWQELLKGVDEDENGEMDLREFKKMMLAVF